MNKDIFSTFREYCSMQGITVEEVFYLGHGANGATKVGRYMFKVPFYSRNASQLFAIQYYRNIDAYIAWNLCEGRLIENYSIDEKEVKNMLGEINLVISNTGYSGQGKRTIYIFQDDCVEKFIMRYVVRGGNKIV